AAHRVAVAGGDVLAAFARGSAAGYAGRPEGGGPGAPVSLLFIHGTDDTVVPFGGMAADTPSGPVLILASVQQTVSYWAAFAGCEPHVTSRTEIGRASCRGRG